MWFREYVLNILIQPFHLLIYTILIGTAINLVQSSIIYAVVAIGFMIPAEKLMRKFFGFDNAGTLSAAGSFAGGALFTAMISKINRPKPGGKGGSGGGDSGNGGRKQTNRKNSSSGTVTSNDTLFKGYGGDDASSQGGQTNSQGGNSGGSPMLTGGGQSGPTNTGGALPIDSEGSATGGTSGLTDEVFANRSKWNLAWGKYTDEEGKTHHKFWGRIGNSIGAMGYRNTQKLKNAAKTLPKSAGRLVRRGFVGGFGGAAAATLFGAAALASGDPSKVAQMAIAGGAAGFYGANHYGDKYSNKVAKGLEGTAEAGRNAFWGGDVKQLNQAKFDKEFKESPETIDALTQVLGTRGKARDAINDGSVQALLNNNITDPVKVGKALKLRDNLMKGMPDKDGHPTRTPITNPDEALERAVRTAQWNRDAGKGLYETNSRARQVFKNQTVAQVIAANPGISKQEASKRVDQILDDMESFEI